MATAILSEIQTIEHLFCALYGFWYACLLVEPLRPFDSGMNPAHLSQP